MRLQAVREEMATSLFLVVQLFDNRSSHAAPASLFRKSHTAVLPLSYRRTVAPAAPTVPHAPRGSPLSPLAIASRFASFLAAMSDLRDPFGGPQDVFDLFVRMVRLDPERAGRIVVSFDRRPREHWPAFIASLNGPRPPDRGPGAAHVAANEHGDEAMDGSTSPEELESVSPRLTLPATPD